MADAEVGILPLAGIAPGPAFNPRALFGDKFPDYNSDWLAPFAIGAKSLLAEQEHYLPITMNSYANNPALHKVIDVALLGVLAEKMSWIQKELLPIVSSNDTKWKIRTVRMINTELHETPNLATSTVMQKQVTTEEVVAVRYGKSIPFENDELSTEEGRKDLRIKMACWAAAIIQKMAYIGFAAIATCDQRPANHMLYTARSLREFMDAHHRYKLEFAYCYKGGINLNVLISKYADLMKEINEGQDADLVIVPPHYDQFLNYRSALQINYDKGGQPAVNTVATDPKPGSISRYRVRTAPGIYDENERRILASLSTVNVRLGSYYDFAVDYNRKKLERDATPAQQTAHAERYIVGEIYDTKQNKHVTITVEDCMKGLSNFFSKDERDDLYHVRDAAGLDGHHTEILNENGLVPGAALDLEDFLDKFDFVGLLPNETQVMDSLYLVVSKGGIGNTYSGVTRYEAGVKAETQESIFTMTKWMTAHVPKKERVVRIANQLFAGYVCGKDSQIIDPDNFRDLSETNFDDDRVGLHGSIYMMFQKKSQFKPPEFVFSIPINNLFTGADIGSYRGNILHLIEHWCEVFHFPANFNGGVASYLNNNRFSIVLYQNGMSNYYRGVFGRSCASQTHVQYETVGTREVRDYGYNLLPGCENK